ncbi:MAG: hypothetical protein A3J12_06835 [Omnitrophica bacterium RIFCSPLOWO2_02_FULL_44_11]|nr:MAG: hypothetical protein A3B72_05625 [Omnitrophica bacterium RIFCSPHIGHO2_02_FULL_45_28]OGX02687.1 MAG: hypothetical protein A3J12_06835 [Omnitrophica bacterium RIFCSPLOWO2_02_FULL_44_11]
MEQKKLAQILAKDVMKTGVITVPSNTNVLDLIKLFQTQLISGAPVVDPGGKIVGVVSATDIIRSNMLKKEEEESVSPYFKIEDIEDNNTSFKAVEASQFKNAETQTVEEIMTPWTLSVNENTPVIQVAQMMVKHRVHRVLVVGAKEQVLGIITAMDMTELVAKTGN